jgi:RNA recognition motif-containing protein
MLIYRRNPGFTLVDFKSPQAAQRALLYNGTPNPPWLGLPSARLIRLQWARLGNRKHLLSYNRLGSSIFVENLDPDVTEHMLTVIFQLKYKSCYYAEIVFDPISGNSRGYGFVRFWSRWDRDRALSEMQDVYCGKRAMRIRPALRRGGFNGRPFPAIAFWPCGWIIPWNAGTTFRARINGTNEVRQGSADLRSSIDIGRNHVFHHFANLCRSNIPSSRMLRRCPICRPPRQLGV